MPKRLSLSPALYPVEAFFNRLSHEMFKRALKNFAEGHGYNPENMTCFFPREIAEDTGIPESEICHIEIWTYAGDNEVEVSLGDFMQYLQTALEVENESIEDADLINLGNKALLTLQTMKDVRNGAPREP